MYKKFKGWILVSDREDKILVSIVFSFIVSLVLGFTLGEKKYYNEPYERVAKDFLGDEYINNYPYEFNFNYMAFFFSILFFSCVFYLILKHKKPTSLLDETQKTIIPIVIKGYRKAGMERNCAPTSKTSDAKIIEIYQTVISAFNNATKTKNEKIPALNLNYIALKFFQVYELTGEEGFKSHLKYEIEKYLNEGLREEYNRELELIPTK